MARRHNWAVSARHFRARADLPKKKSHLGSGFALNETKPPAIFLSHKPPWSRDRKPRPEVFARSSLDVGAPGRVNHAPCHAPNKTCPAPPFPYQGEPSVTSATPLLPLRRIAKHAATREEGLLWHLRRFPCCPIRLWIEAIEGRDDPREPTLRALQEGGGLLWHVRRFPLRVVVARPPTTMAPGADRSTRRPARAGVVYDRYFLVVERRDPDVTRHS